jgi:predicted nucleotidyltransferase
MINEFREMAMNTSTQAVLDSLRTHEAKRRALGVHSLALSGSVARGEATAGSDVDLVIRLGPGFSKGGFEHFGPLEELRLRLAEIVVRDVDVVEEPVGKERLRREIEAVRVDAFVENGAGEG